MKFPEIVLTVLVMAKFVGAQRQGDPCTVVKTGQVGSCLHLSKCPTVLNAAYRNISPQICGMEDTVAIVCCPPVSVLEGSQCTLNDNVPGVCRAFSNCPRAMKAAVRGVVPQKCDLTDNKSELVCCEDFACSPLPKGYVTQLPLSSKAANYCMELAEKIYPCLETSSGWTRGNMCPLLTPDVNMEYHKTPMTSTAEAPYYGRIGQGNRGDISWWDYPVSLVSDRWVISVGYTVYRIGSNNINFIGLGGTFTPSYNPDETYGVTQVHVHPLYDVTYASYYSIALIQLDKRVKFTSRILPVCLHTGTPLPDSGFLYTVRDDSAEIKTTMRRVSEDECSRLLPTGDSHHPVGVKHDIEICSRPFNSARVCPTWYGGAMLTLPNSPRSTCTNLLVGVVTWSTGCTFAFTRISAFVPWIEGIVWPDSGVVV